LTTAIFVGCYGDTSLFTNTRNFSDKIILSSVKRYNLMLEGWKYHDFLHNNKLLRTGCLIKSFFGGNEKYTQKKFSSWDIWCGLISCSTFTEEVGGKVN
jgi:hypothetical protein